MTKPDWMMEVEWADAQVVTEAQWVAGHDLRSLVARARAEGSRRQRRLLDCACGRFLASLSPDSCVLKAMAAAERHADGALADSTLRRWRTRLDRLYLSVYTASGSEERCMALHVASLACLPLARRESGLGWAELIYTEGFFGRPVFSSDWLRNVERAAGCAIRDILGNPFRRVAFDPRWRTADVLGLARGIYEDRAFDRLPLLADALIDAGCADGQVLGHCRNGDAHYRGCWAVDLVLGKD